MKTNKTGKAIMLAAVFCCLMGTVIAVSLYSNETLTAYAANPPYFQLKDGGMNNISSGSYVSGTFAVQMYNSKYIFVKEPGGSENKYQPSSDTMIFSRSANGWYTVWTQKNTFWEITDSSSQTVGVDTVKPTMTLTGKNGTVYSGSLVSGSFSASASDSFSGVAAMYVKTPSASSYVRYYGAAYSSSGTYNLYCTDNAGNTSSTYTITVDTAAPVLSLYAGGVSVSSGAHKNASNVQFAASDSGIGLDGIYVRTPGNSSYTKYTSSSVTFTAEGTYYVYAVDKGGYSTSTYNVTLDRTAPVVSVKNAGGTSLTSGKYYSATQINAYASDTNGLSFYVRRGSTGATSTITSGAAFTAEDTYYFYATDAAGNTSSEFVMTIDRTAPIGNTYADGNLISGAFTSAARISYTATDANGCSVYVKTPGSASYAVISSGTSFTAEGQYSFYTLDSAGNRSETKTVTIDRTKPTVNSYGDGVPAENSTVINAEYLTLSASDTGSGVKSIYVLKPGAFGYTVYTSGTRLTEEGTYRFYAEDNVSLESGYSTVTLDRTSPTGIVYVGSTGTANGSYTNKAFKYTAVDTGSGLAYLQILRPGGDWESYTNGAEVTGADGTYYFRAYDSAGNESVTSYIIYDTTLPSVAVYGDSIALSYGAFTNAVEVRFFGDDAHLDKCYIKKPGDTGFSIAGNNAVFTEKGRYEFYCTDKSLNQSPVCMITVDREKPTGRILTGGVEVSDGAYLNTAFSYAASDNYEISTIQYRRDDGSWQSYENGRVLSVLADGKYSFRAFDLAGNISDERYMYYDVTPPAVSIRAEAGPVPDGGFTNTAALSFTIEDENFLTAYVKTPGSNAFILYNPGSTFSAAGNYEVYATDKSGNASRTYSVTIDRTPKAVEIGNMKITWLDIAGFATIVSVTVNDVAISNGTAIRVIDGGEYTVQSTDEAGNVWTYSFIAESEDVLTKTVNISWWEAGGYAFDSYDKALAYVVSREQTLVKVSAWNNSEWDAGIMMDSYDAANAKPGTFYLYKKHDDASTEVAYFTLERLNAVIKSYAEKQISQYWYFEKTAATAYLDNNLYVLSDSNVVIANRVQLNASAKYLLNGNALDAEYVTAGGMHILTVYDDYGNSYAYTLYIVTELSELYYRDANGDYYLADSSKTYFFKNRFTVKMTDSVDGYAMTIIYNGSGEIVTMLNEGEEYILSEPGKYVVRTVNHFGHQDYVFYISDNAATIEATADDISKRLNVTISPSPDRDVYVTAIMVWYAVDNENWTQLTADDYGYTITPDRPSYDFYTTGYYRITVEDTVRSGIDKIITEVYYAKPAPTITAYGLHENGYTNEDVWFVWSDEAYASLSYDSETSTYKSGTVLTESREYCLSFYDYDGYEEVYYFTINKDAPVITASTPVIDGYVITPITLSFTKENCTAELLRDGIPVEFVSGDTVSIDGEYTLTVTDIAGNIATLKFILDTTPPEAILSGVENGGSTKDTVTMSDLSEPAAITVYLNDREILYSIGDKLTDEGRYRVVIIDLAGNITEYRFEILFSLSAASIAVIALSGTALIGGTAAILIARKRKKFKGKK